MTPVRAAATDGLAEGMEKYLEFIRKVRPLSRNTVEAYEDDLRDYCAFARRHRISSWNEATATFIDGYFAHLSLRRVAAATLARRRSAIRGFHRHLTRDEAVPDPFIQIAPARFGRKLPH